MSMANPLHPTSNHALLAWVDKMTALCKPKEVVWCDGSQEEYDRLCEQMVQNGTFIRLNPDKRPNCFLARTHPSDVARVEERTFICSPTKDDVGPTNNWAPPQEMRARLDEMFSGCMRGRTMYVIPFSMGPLGLGHCPDRRADQRLPYVVVNMRIMTRMGQQVLDVLGDGSSSRACTRSVPRWPRAAGRGVALRNRHRQEVHRALPRDARDLVVRLGLRRQRAAGQEVLALRIASAMARDEGWLAEHMLILKLHRPKARRPTSRRRFPRLRQDQPGHARAAHPRKAGRSDGGRRHRLDQEGQRRHAARHQPRGRLLRRGARHQLCVQRQRDGHDDAQLDLHQRGAHRRRRRVVGGHGRPPRRRTHRLAGQGLDARLRPRRPRTPTRASRRRPASALPSTPTGRTRMACRSARSSSVAGPARTCRWSSSPSTGRTACTWRPRWVPKPRPRPSA
jgi:hypothetical protein